MLSTAELEQMRADAAAALPDLATIRRIARTKDGEGGNVLAPADLATDVPCRIDPPGGLADEERTIAEQVSPVLRAKVTFAAGQDVTEADQLVIGLRVWEVRSVLPAGEWELTRTVLVSEVRP